MEQRNTNEGTPSEETPNILIDRGWRQGMIFRASGVPLSCIERGENGQPVSVTRHTPTDGRFVVVSQSCDIAARLSVEPVVEAFACSVEPDRSVRASYNRSFRWFEIDREEGLIARAMDRVAFHKRFLLDLDPLPWSDSMARLRRFQRWLGRRASRHALPTEIVEAFVRPLNGAIEQLRNREDAAYQAFDNAVEEIRIILPEIEAPPFEISLILVLASDELSAEAGDALERVRALLAENLDASVVELSQFAPTTKSRMPVETYFNSALVGLEHLTYRGEHTAGAEPNPNS